MRGHDDLIKMRMMGRKPESVFFYDYPIDTDWASWGETPRIAIHGDDVVDMDLRFVVGLKVHVSTTRKMRGDAFFDKCVDAGAEIVALSVEPENDPYAKQKSQLRFFFRNFGGINDNHHHTRHD